MDRIFQKNEIEQICREIKKVLKKSLDYMEDMQSIADRAQRALLEVPAEVRENSAEQAARQLRSYINRMDFDSVISKLEKCKSNVNEKILPADSRYAKQTDALRSDVQRIEKAVRQIQRFLADVPLTGSSVDFNFNFELMKFKYKELIEDVSEAVNKLLMNVKGEEVKSVWFSKDPVNLSTGNFIYAHTDLDIKGEFPFRFRRFYNSLNQRKGVLGKDWNHNHEIFLEKSGREIILNLEDGKEERFLSVSGDGYLSVYQGTGTLVQTEDGYEYTTREQRKYCFDMEGYCISQSGRKGGCLKYIYEQDGDKKRLKRIESTAGQFFELAYDAEGFLQTLIDHTGRKISYEIQDGFLLAASTPNGDWYCYGYTPQGKLKYTKNPEGTVTVKNTFDERMRTTKQRFPDGSRMAYEYDDEKQETRLTERNGSQIIYVHDDQFRDVKHIYSDGEECFEYNKRGQRTLFVDKLGNRTRYAYDDRGNRTRIINPVGNEMMLEYGPFNQVASVEIDGVRKVQNRFDEKGNLIESENAEGNVFRFRYREQGRADRILQPDGGVVTLERDARGNITCLTDPEGFRHLFVYDELNQVVETVDGNGNRTSYAYDDNGNIIRVTNPEGNTRTYTYNKNNKVTRIVDFDGSVTTREYNALNLPCKVTDKMGRTTLLAYDCMWNVAKVTQPDGTETAFLYDEHNHLARICNANGDMVYYTYDAVGHRISKTDELGNTSRFFYDAAGRLTKVQAPEGGCTEYGYDAEGNVLWVRDALGNEVHLEYDKNGKLTRETTPLGESRTYTYDCMGHLSSVTNETGQTTVYEYGKCGHLLRVIYPEGKSAVYTYDGNGNVKTYTNPRGYQLTYTYDSLDRVVKIENSSKEVKQYTYDGMDNVLSMKDSSGAVTQYEYSLTGKLLKVTDPLGNETTYEYDDRDRLVSVCRYGEGMDPELKNVQEINRNCRITRYEHDRMGNLTKVTDGLGQIETYEYDKAGRLAAKVDREGYLTKYSYTPSGNLSQIRYADGREVKLSYNAIRQLIQMEDWLGTTTVASDAMGHVTDVSFPDGKEVSYTYGPRGERAGITYPDGKQVQYEYNEFTRLEKLIQGEQAISYAYDDTGFLSRKVFPNGVETEYSYDERGRLLALVHRDSTGELDSCRYAYDMAGNRSCVTRMRRGMEEESGSYEYRYDLLGRLTEVMKDGIQQRAYTYDPFGNRSRMTEDGAETRYAYNEGNQLVLKTEDALETTYAYDRRGNLEQVLENGSVVSRYLYDATNRLAEAEGQHRGSAQYQYNGFGQRTGKTTGEGKETVYLPDPTRQYHNLLQKTEEGTKQTYLWDGGVAALLEEGSQELQYYLKDELGSPIRLMYQDGELHESYAYDEFGREMHSGQKNTEPVQPFGFTGYQYDREADTYFAQMREYQPETGRFAARDIVPGFKDMPFTMNRYTYCYNNPVLLVDRNGMFPSLETVTDTLSDWGDSVSNTLDDWGDAFADGVDSIAEASADVVEDVTGWITDIGNQHPEVIEQIKGKLKDPVHTICKGISKGTGFTYATQQGYTDGFLESVDFHRDKAGIFHTSPDCWQQYMGYCDLYDWVFDTATDMKVGKYEVPVGDDMYCIWMWKGDYLNLGAGAETGIYKGGEPFWDVSVEDAMPMTLTLYDKDGNTIMCYMPDDPQWWITGFDSMTQDVDPDDLTVIGSIDMSSYPELWEAFLEEYGGLNSSGFCFDEENKTVYYNW